MDAVDKGHYVGALLLDFTKAFDSIPHQLLLTELQITGCSTDTTTWFYNYLTDWEQRVITHEQVTEWMAVSRGFPQGSGLRPLIEYSSTDHRRTSFKELSWTEVLRGLHLV